MKRLAPCPTLRSSSWRIPRKNEPEKGVEAPHRANVKVLLSHDLRKRKTCPHKTRVLMSSIGREPKSRPKEPPPTLKQKPRRGPKQRPKPNLRPEPALRSPEVPKSLWCRTHPRAASRRHRSLRRWTNRPGTILPGKVPLMLTALMLTALTHPKAPKESPRITLMTFKPKTTHRLPHPNIVVAPHRARRREPPPNNPVEEHGSMIETSDVRHLETLTQNVVQEAVEQS